MIYEPVKSGQGDDIFVSFIRVINAKTSQTLFLQFIRSYELEGTLFIRRKQVKIYYLQYLDCLPTRKRISVCFDSEYSAVTENRRNSIYIPSILSFLNYIKLSISIRCVFLRYLQLVEKLD